jgi:hypothetical protein
MATLLARMTAPKEDESYNTESEVTSFVLKPPNDVEAKIKAAQDLLS